ncbi:hypothetical protein [Paenibacillus sp. GCM10027626]|uniref:hypothetical protein n=1 Tax=Paenibacillus sp. GCM10027626 TaxID=3273411 RepID=UPI003627BF14
MKRRKVIYSSFISIVVITSLFILTAWSPWISESYARMLAIKKFEKLSANVQDGCGVNCDNCGAKGVKPVLFGKNVTIEYNCGGPYENEEAMPQNYKTIAYISFLYKLNY